MSALANIKATLISKIHQIEDSEILETILEWIDASDQEVFELNGQQESSIQKGRQNIIEGKQKDHSSVISNAEQWLNAR